VNVTAQLTAKDLCGGEELTGGLRLAGQAALLGNDCGRSLFDGATVFGVGVELV
jgi:hypothetical protein